MRIQLSDNIRTLRKEHGMMQEQLADTLDVTIGAVSKWERGGTLSTTAIHDNLGKSALDGAEGFMKQVNNSDPQLTELRESIKQENKKL